MRDDDLACAILGLKASSIERAPLGTWEVRDAVTRIVKRLDRRRWFRITPDDSDEIALLNDAARTLARLGDPIGEPMMAALGLDPSGRALAEAWTAMVGLMPDKETP